MPPLIEASPVTCTVFVFVSKIPVVFVYAPVTVMLPVRVAVLLPVTSIVRL